MEISIIFLAISLFFLLMLFNFSKQYIRCPSNKILVVYGKVGKNHKGEIVSAKCYHGESVFVFPVIQDYEFLDLTPIKVKVDLSDILSNDNQEFSISTTSTVAIGTNPILMENASDRLIGLKTEHIRELADVMITGQIRLATAITEIEEIKIGNEKFLSILQESTAHELQKIGLELINITINNIKQI